MRGFKLVGACLTAVLLFAVLPVASASAGKVLILSNEEHEVATGAPTDAGLFMGGCVGFSEGVLSVNHAAKDKITTTKSGTVECSEEGVSEAGTISETVLATNGKASMVGKVSITKPGSCTYEFSKFKGAFAIPGLVVFEGSAKGKLSKSSPKTCAKSALDTFEADVTNPTTLEPFQAEL